MALNPCVALKAADKAYYELNTGASVRRIVDQNGETVEFSSANRAGLLAYIAALQLLCPSYTALALGSMRTKPMKFFF